MAHKIKSCPRCNGGQLLYVAPNKDWECLQCSYVALACPHYTIRLWPDCYEDCNFGSTDDCIYHKKRGHK